MAIKEINIFKNVLCFLIFIFSHQLNANDGAFYMQGNHLIPITENQVSISKEILTITQRGGVFYIDVDYTFYNPGNEKEVLMGFEAPLPYGAAYSKTFSREHPFLNDFTVKFNGASLEYKSDLVDIDAFKNESNLKTISNHEFNNFKERVRNYGYDYSNLGSYIYVNYFTVNFKPGKNKIRHTYSFKQSGRIDFPLQFQYILTAANRWAGGKIDDFTLNLKMRSFSEFYINQSFFEGMDNWKKHPNMKIVHKDDGAVDNLGFEIGIDNGKGCLVVRTKNESLQYHQKNFRPEGELFIWNTQAYFYWSKNLDDYTQPFDNKIDEINYEFYDFFNYVFLAKDETSLKILRNYPFAIRGYAFKNKEIRNYYNERDWYQVDQNYDGNYKNLFEYEKEWLKRLKVVEN